MSRKYDARNYVTPRQIYEAYLLSEDGASSTHIAEVTGIRIDNVRRVVKNINIYLNPSERGKIRKASHNYLAAAKMIKKKANDSQIQQGGGTAGIDKCIFFGKNRENLPLTTRADC